MQGVSSTFSVSQALSYPVKTESGLGRGKEQRPGVAYGFACGRTHRRVLHGHHARRQPVFPPGGKVFLRESGSASSRQLYLDQAGKGHHSV